MAAYMLAGIFSGTLAGDVLIYISAGIFALAAFTDFLDGNIARRRNLVTATGNFLDTVADKVLVVSALILITGYGLVPTAFGVIISAVIVGRELAVLALKMMASVKNIMIVADKLGKAKAVSQFLAIIMILPAKPFDAAVFSGTSVAIGGAALGPIALAGLILLTASALLTLVSAVNYFVKNRKVFTESKN